MPRHQDAAGSQAVGVLGEQRQQEGGAHEVAAGDPAVQLRRGQFVDDPGGRVAQEGLHHGGDRHACARGGQQGAMVRSGTGHFSPFRRMSREVAKRSRRASPSGCVAHISTHM